MSQTTEYWQDLLARAESESDAIRERLEARIMALEDELSLTRERLAEAQRKLDAVAEAMQLSL